MKAKQAEEVTRATALMDRIESLIEHLETIAEQAQKDRAWSAAAGAVREIRGCLTLLAQMRGELASDARSSINLTLAIRQVRAAAKTGRADQSGEILQLIRDLLDAVSDEQFTSLAQDFGVQLDPLEEFVSGKA